MRYEIQYAGLCLQGLVRLNNEDNYWCLDHCLPVEHRDTELFSGRFSSGEGASFGVFDGMGGELCGEVAAFLAAEEYGNRLQNRKSKWTQEEETALCHGMNRKVLEYAEQHHAPGMGSTAVTLRFAEDGIRGWDIGDSRCYRYSENKLYALSTDHALVSPVTRRSRLTQCLGISEKEFLLEPAFYSVGYESGDRYLLCSDGLTSMVGPIRLEGVLSENIGIEEKVESLREMVFKKGAEDNVTILLFEVL